MSDHIDETLTTSKTTSTAINGLALVPYSERGERKTAAMFPVRAGMNRHRAASNRTAA
ncbi:MAG: hypothetical protein OXF97_09520 [Nitrospira sp.]|nr:hypothetical protein [Nitrospira sp.]